MKPIRIILLALCIVLAATVCRAEEEPEPTKVAVFREKGVTIALPDNWKPYSFVDEHGERAGYLVDFWRLWADRTGLMTRFEYLEREAALEAVKTGEADILGGEYASPDLEEFLAYAGSVHPSTSVLAIREDGPVDCANALWKGRVAVVDEKDTLRWLKAKYPELGSVVHPDPESAVATFLDGQTDAVIVGYPYLAKIGGERGVMDALNICRTLLYHDVYAGVLKHETELLELVETGFSGIPSETLKEIESRWFLTAERPKPDLLAAALPAAVAFMVILGAIVLWMRRRK